VILQGIPVGKLEGMTLIERCQCSGC